jgi:ABC-type polysaccharide/polyol phosphate export permease
MSAISNYIGAGFADIEAGLGNWRTWRMLAWNDVRRRYRRSRVGQFWLTLSMGTTVGGLGVIYPYLFGLHSETYIPYIAVTFVAWGFISTVVNESCTAFNENDQLLRAVTLPRSLFAYRVIARNLVVSAHNFLIIPIVFAVYHVGLNANILWLIVGLALLVVNSFWVGYFLAIVCARFRDVPQIVASVMQLAFFVTPVIFLPQQLAHRGGIFLIKWNPLANLLEVVRDPLLGTVPSLWALASCAAMGVIGLAVLVPFAGRFAPRAVYWV